MAAQTQNSATDQQMQSAYSYEDLLKMRRGNTL